MADKNAEVAVEDNGGMKKTLSLWNFFTIGFGAIIGTGWVLQVGDWMVVGGGPVPAMIAFLLGAIFLVPVGAVFGELTAAIPISGGIVEYRPVRPSPAIIRSASKHPESQGHWIRLPLLWSVNRHRSLVMPHF